MIGKAIRKEKAEIGCLGLWGVILYDESEFFFIIFSFLFSFFLINLYCLTDLLYRTYAG